MITDYSTPLTPPDWGRRIAELEDRINRAVDLLEAYTMCDVGECCDCDLLRRAASILKGEYQGDSFDWTEYARPHKRPYSELKERIRRLVAAGDGLYDRGEHHRDCLIPCTCGWDAAKAEWDRVKEG